MEYDFVVINDVWHYETREYELYVRGPKIELHLPWTQITGAGGVQRRAIPSWRANSGQVMVATDRLLYLPVERNGDQHERFIADLQARLGERWYGHGLGDIQLRKRLGYATWWVCPVTILFALLIGAVLVGALGIVGVVAGLIEDYFWILMILGLVYIVARWMKKIRS